MPIIFDIKMDGNFTIKAIWVAENHTTEPPSYITYSSAVYIESVRILFLLASLNDSYNAYIKTRFKETLCTEART